MDGSPSSDHKSISTFLLHSRIFLVANILISQIHLFGTQGLPQPSFKVAIVIPVVNKNPQKEAVSAKTDRLGLVRAALDVVGGGILRGSSI